MKKYIILILISLFTFGCATHKWLPQTVAALGTNTNSLTINVTTPWGSANLYRNVKP